MGMDLEGAGGYFRWTGEGWCNILGLAQRHGWVSTGTGPPRGTLKSRWCGAYDSNDGQLFYAHDARKLAAALEIALAGHGRRRLRPPKKYSWFLSPIGRKAVREFIAFCRKGSFRIY